MKRLLTTTAIVLLASVGAAQAGDTVQIDQDFDLDGDQFILNELYGAAIEDAFQGATNLGNSIEFVDTSSDAGTTGDFFDFFQDASGESQVIEQELEASAGSIGGDQRATNLANLVNATDEFGNGSTADIVEIDQEFDSSDQEIDNDILANNHDAGRITASDTSTLTNGLAEGVDGENLVNPDDNPLTSSQRATNLANFVDLTENGNNLTGIDVTIDQDILDDSSQDINNNAQANAGIAGLSQTATNLMNGVNLAFVDLVGSGTVDIDQDGSDDATQEIENIADADDDVGGFAGVASDVAQVASNLQNIVTFDTGN